MPASSSLVGPRSSFDPPPLTIDAEERRERLCKVATEIHRSVIETIDRAGAGQIGGDLSAIDTLARPFPAVQIDVSTLKPLDEEAIIAVAREPGAIAAQEATTEGGRRVAVSEVVVRNAAGSMRILGVKGLAPTGSATSLLEHFGLSPDGVVAAALELKRQ